MKKPCPFCSGTVTADARKFDIIFEHHLANCHANPKKEKPE